MSARRRKKRSRKRGRNDGLDDNILSQLRGMGFTTQQIEDITQDVIDRPINEQFDAALELLLLNANNEDIDKNHNHNHNHNHNGYDEPPTKRRRVIDLSEDIDQDEHNHISSEEEKKSQNDETRKKTHVEIKEEEFNKQQQEMDEKENEYKKWEERQIELENIITSIRDNINDICKKIPKLPDSKDKEINKDDAKVEELLTERMQLYGIIEHITNGINQHLKFCNEKVGEQFMKKEMKKEQLRKQKERFEQSVQEFQSEKFALQLMQDEVKSGAIQMTLVEHNLFVVASAANNASEEQVDNDHFKDLSNKIKALQNRKKEQDDNSNSKEEKAVETENENENGKGVEFECQICFDSYSKLSEILIFDGCYHYYCMNCLSSHLKVKLKDRNVRNLLCPHDKCEHQLSHKEIRQLLAKEEFAKFDEYLLDKTLQSAKDCRFCPGVDCGAAMFGYSDSPMLQCPKCSKQFCFNCGTEEWHQGVTCAKFKKWKEENGKADMKFDEWVKNQNAKQCPNCKTMIEKNGGCDHMTYVVILMY